MAADPFNPMAVIWRSALRLIRCSTFFIFVLRLLLLQKYDIVAGFFIFLSIGFIFLVSAIIKLKVRRGTTTCYRFSYYSWSIIHLSLEKKLSRKYSFGPFVDITTRTNY